MTPETLQELFDTPRDKIDFDGEVYAINQKLKLAPWMPSVVHVWVADRPNWENAANWLEVRNLLLELHDEHTRRQA